MLCALCPDQPAPDESAYELPPDAGPSDVRRVRAVALKFAFACGLERRKFSAKSIATTAELVRFLSLVAMTFGKGTNMAIFGKSAQLHAPGQQSLSAPPGRQPAPSAGLESLSAFVARLADFELLERVGEGSFGTVTRARDASGQIVAVKSLKPGGMTADALGFFDREVSVMASVSHPAVYSYGDRHVLKYRNDIDSSHRIGNVVLEVDSKKELSAKRFIMV
jgi:hypothetical protein